MTDQVFMFAFAAPKPPAWKHADVSDRARYHRIRPQSRQHAVEFNYEEALDHDGERFCVSRVKVNCPYCQRTNAPLRSTRTRLVYSDWRWVGLDHKEPYEAWLCVCPGCGKDYAMTTYTPQ